MVLVEPVILVVLFCMTLSQTLILAIVEGFTEFLPVSSTGHLILASHFLNIEQTEFVKSFEIIIQLGAILAVVTLYWKRVVTNINLIKPMIAAFIPTAIVGFLFYPFIKRVLFENTAITLLALFLGGIALIAIEMFYKGKESTEVLEKISIKQGFLIGVAQSFSIVPGVSRAAATILGALFVGASRKTAVEFSFLLAIPTMVAATGLDLLKTGFSFAPNEWTMLAIGFVGSFLTALLAVKYFLAFIQNHTFIPFGIYRIFLAIAFWFLIQ